MNEKLPPKILVIDSDDFLKTSTCSIISRYWFIVLKADSENKALHIFKLEKPNLVIISSRLKGLTAVEMAYKIRNLSPHVSIPIIFVIDPDENKDRYKNFSNDLAEYLVRPYDSDSLMKMIRDLIRKARPELRDRIIKHENLVIDLMNEYVYKDNKRITLTPTEYKILVLLVEFPQKIFSREQIIEYVWGFDSSVAVRTVDVHINRLKKVLQDVSYDDDFIKTIRSSGYCLNLN